MDEVGCAIETAVGETEELSNWPYAINKQGNPAPPKSDVLHDLGVDFRSSQGVVDLPSGRRQFSLQRAKHQAKVFQQILAIENRLRRCGNSLI